MKNIKALILISGLVSSAVFACRVDVLNDGTSTVIIGEKKAKELKILNPGKTTYVGSESYRPDIILYMQETEGGPLKKKYQIVMVGCAHSKKASLTVKNIMQDSYDKELFKATPYTSNMHKTLMNTPDPMEH